MAHKIYKHKQKIAHKFYKHKQKVAHKFYKHKQNTNINFSNINLYILN
jgi:hypothetical protein